ncbi:MAG: hypothetical protein ACOX5R_21035 [bacterium]
MKIIKEGELKEQMERVLKETEHDCIGVVRDNKIVSIFIPASKEDPKPVQEDTYWGERAKAAEEEEEWLSPEESLQEFTNRHNEILANESEHD